MEKPKIIPYQTRYEKILFDKLKDCGLLVYSNKKLFGYYPDILLPKYKLIIEVDGGIHNMPKNKIKDAQRDAKLAEYGYTTIRFKNYQVQKNLSGVVANILKRVKETELSNIT